MKECSIYKGLNLTKKTVKECNDIKPNNVLGQLPIEAILDKMETVGCVCKKYTGPRRKNLNNNSE